MVLVSEPRPLTLIFIFLQDIDDPMSGFFVRDEESKLQGFITCTTFTNWQKSFRWDSVHESAFSYDDDVLSQQMLEGDRTFDTDGSLAAELQQTIRCGDPWNEGIVWPQLAEISLLGGLGCGKALLSLAIERLETMKATPSQNYDYAVLQATENSVPFYESMGFVRVGALTVDDQFEKKKAVAAREDDDTESEDTADPTSSDDSLAEPSEVVSSPVNEYVVEKPGETPMEIAKKFNVPVWNLVFLNHYLYKDLNSRSRLMKGTNLYIPSDSAAKSDASSLVRTKKDLEGESSAPRWYIASENDTPKMIAKKFGVSCKELVGANIDRLPELLPISRLKEGTRVKVSHFHLHEDEHVPYCHWSFPDDSFEHGEPSYMMARKLNRRSGVSAKARPIQSSLAVPVSKYVRPPSSLFHIVTVPAKTPKSHKKKVKQPKATFEIPGKPKRPLTSYVIFCNEHRELLRKELAGKPASESSKVLAARWKELSDKEKAVYQKKYDVAKKLYEKVLAQYEKNLARFFEKHPEMRPDANKEDDQEEEDASEEEGTLFNKVVTVKPEALRDSHKDYKYFYVLTYIPDLMWCHLVPMRQVGYWGDDKPSCEGRPIWMLVDESEGKEVDVSASFCQPVISRGLRRTVDADEEQWDIPDNASPRKSAANKSGKPVAVAKVVINRANDGTEKAAPSTTASKKNSVTTNAASTPKKRKRDTTDSPSSSALAVSPNVRERDLPARRAAPLIENNELSPPSKKRKVSSKSDETSPDKARCATREMPRRKAAPQGEGIFCEAKSPLARKDSPIPPKRTPGKTPKKGGRGRKNPVEETKNQIATRELSPRKAAPLAEGIFSIFSKAKPRVAKKDSPLPAKRAPGKTLRKRGGRLSKNPVQDTPSQIVTSSRPRRKAAAATEGLFSECTPTKRKMKPASDLSDISAKGKDVTHLTINEGDKLAASLPLTPLKTLPQQPEPLKENTNTPDKVARTYSASNDDVSPRLRKRTRIDVKQNAEPSSDTKQARPTKPASMDVTSTFLHIPPRKAAPIFNGAETSTLLGRLIAS